jgi:inhibitor of cysteine peptidase
MPDSHKRKNLRPGLTLAVSLSLLAALTLCLAAGSRAKTAKTPRRVDEQTPSYVDSTSVVLDLKDFGAAGDGITDDGPALQSALDALADAGGGTLNVPAGRYAILTPVAKSFAGLDASVTISGVPSAAQVAPPDASATSLAHGLELTTEFLPRTETSGNTLTLAGLRAAVVKDIAFVGTPGVNTDARNVLNLYDVDDASITHSEFYGLSTSTYGSEVFAVRSRLRIERSVFLGCTANSGAYTPVVMNLEWKGFTIEEAIFLDYGLRPELFSKTGLAAPQAWVQLGNAAALTNDSPRREAVFRSIFMDEGGFTGIASLPDRYTQPPSAPIDLVYITGLKMNVSNLGSQGHYLTRLRAALIEDSAYGWSHNTDAAISLFSVGHAILDRIKTEASATRLRADAATARLTVIDSVYTDLASLSPQTFVINTTQPGEDPVQYVRERFESVLARAPDAAAHFYWSDRILRCGADAVCDASARTALDAYLAASPSETFQIQGRVADEGDSPLAGVAVALTGSQSVSTTTDASGLYHFSNLPTSGVYNVNVSKRHYAFNAPSQTFTTPATDVRGDFAAVLERHAVSGRVTDDAGSALAGATLALTGSKSATTTSDSNGNYIFDGLAAGGAYNIAASKTDYAFAPASVGFTDLSADAGADFRGTPTVRSVFGFVVNINNGGMQGIPVALSGSRTATTTTAADGSYRFDGLPVGGSYTVKPTLLGYVFSPASQSFNNLNADQYAGFVGGYVEHRIAGRVAQSGGAPFSGVTVTLAGSKTATATTDSNGGYAFDVPSGGDYIVTASKAHFTITPQSQTFTNLGADKTADFGATLLLHTVSGRVTKTDGSPLAGATVALTGSKTATTTTDVAGNYSFQSLDGGGSYTLTATKANYTFAPTGRTFDDLSSNQTADFAATLLNYRIGGRVTENGSGLGGVTVALAGSQSASMMTAADGSYSFTVAAEGDYTVTAVKTHYAFAPQSQTFTNLDVDKTANFAATHKEVIEFEAAALSVGEGGGTLEVAVTRTGDTSEEVSAVYEVESGTAVRGSDVVGSTGRVTFAPGETTKTFTLFITDDTHVEGAENFSVLLTPEGEAVAGERASVAVTINDNDTDPMAPNAIDDAAFFVRQHYRDFLGREPDASGLAFWTDQITSCGADAGCRDVKRINVSAAFFLSIEFQETGFFVYKTYRAAYGQRPDRLGEFTLDSRDVSAGVVVGETGWEQKLEFNKAAYVADFIARSQFEETFPLSLTPAQFVSALDANAGRSLTSAERDTAAAEFGGAQDTSNLTARARVLRLVVDNAAFHRRETNPAFVLMQYFGYMRREPDEVGYDFWLQKLEDFGGDFRRAEMVKAFIASDEYRQRFGR